MCTGMEVAALIGAGASAVGAVSQATRKAPKIPAPEKPPQERKTADRGAALANNAMAGLPGGPMSGNSGTFLTGPGGIDPSVLNLGRNTLLGQ